MFVLNNTTRLQVGKPWTDKNGTQHPGNWSTWSKDVRESHGIVEVAEDAKPDSRFYVVGDLGLDGKWTARLKNLDDTKDGDKIVSYGVRNVWISKTKEKANTLLAPSDWQVIAKAERDRAIDSDIATYRDAVIKKCAEIEAAIIACKDMDEFKALFSAQVKITTVKETVTAVDGSKEERDVEKEEVIGPALINDWPEQVS
jgi:hypothetical protein